MTLKYKIYLQCLIFFVLLNVAGEQIRIIENGKTGYVIIAGRGKSPVELKAAKILQTYLKKISGVEIPVVSRSTQSKEIIVGKNNDGQIPVAELLETGQDGFLIKKINDKVVIAGKTPEGTLHGVYFFLEKYLGCRWYTSKVEKVPESKDIVIDVKNELQKPVLLYRESGHEDAYHEVFTNKLKLNNGKIISRTQLYEDGKIGPVKKGGFGLWVHASFALVPPYKYFKKHPEYYALRDGKRQATQLCFSNPEVYDIVIRELKKRMDKNHKDIFWDVSQQDNGKYCQCAKCAAIDKREGSHMGSILQFINKVAKTFPDKIITTLAYQYSRKPPKFLKPVSNVGIILCYFTDKRDYLPLAKSDRADAVSFRKDLADWSKICDKIIIWDYLTNYSHFLMPNPNLYTLGPNIKYYVNNNCIGIYAAASSDRGGSFWALRNYLAAKLLWNPNEDPQKVIDDFVNGYYGAAAPYIRKYIDLLHKSLADSKLFLSIYGRPSEYTCSYLSTVMLNQYNALFDQAERAVKDKKELLSRVRIARLPLMYVQLLLKWGTVEQRLEIAKDFFETAEKAGVVILGERRNISWFKDLITGKLQREQELLDKKTGGYSGTGNTFEIKLENPQPINETTLKLDYTIKDKNRKRTYEVEGFSGRKWRTIYRGNAIDGVAIVPLGNILSINYNDSNWDIVELPDKHWRRAPNNWKKFTEDEKHQDMSSGSGWFRKKVIIPADWKPQDIILELGRDGVYTDDDVLVNVFWNGYLLNTCWSENIKKGWYRAAPVLSEKPEYGWARTRHYSIKPEMLNKNGENQLVVWASFVKGPHGLIEGPIKLINKKQQLNLEGKWKMKLASDLSLTEKISKLKIHFNGSGKNEVTGAFSAYKPLRKVLVCGVALTAGAIVAGGDFQNTREKGLEQYKSGKYDDAAKSFAIAAKLSEKVNDKYGAMFYIGRCREKQRNFSGAADVYEQLMKLPGINSEQKSNACIQYLLNVYWGRKYKDVIAAAAKIIADKKATDKMKLKSCELGYLAARNLRQHQESIEFAKKLADYDKKPAGHWNARSLIFQADALRLMKKYDAAVAMLPEDKIKQMHPDRQGDAYIELGIIYDEQKNYGKAVSAYAKAAVAAQNKQIVKKALNKKQNSQKKAVSK